MRRYLQTLTAACLLAGPSIAAAAMTETSQFCNVMTFAQISVPGEDPLFVSQDRRSQELDPYQDISSSALDDGTNQAASHAILDVAFTETRIATSGEFQSAAHIENDGFAEALGTSRYTIDFTLDQPAVCSLGGVAEARDNGHGTVLFRRTDSEILVYQEVNLGRVAVDHLLNLDPGSYTLDVSIGGYGQSFPQIGSVPASGHFDIAFQVLSPTSAPLPGASAVLTAYPNPARDQVGLVAA
ncbi:MAG: hypothetical protein R3E12_15545 [Candidatus Eisenbacteria bacterium]